MGNAYILYYPEGGKTLEEIDLGRKLTDLQEMPDSERASAGSVYGSATVSQYSSIMRVRVVLSRFAGRSDAGALLARKLSALQSHMDRGGMIAVANDISKAYATYSNRGWGRGITTIGTKGNVWDYGTAGRIVAPGDEVVIQSDNPECKREIQVVQSASASVMVLTSGLTFDYADYMLIRHRDFYPMLRFPVDGRQLILTSDRRLNYTLDMVLEEDPVTIVNASILAPDTMTGSTSVGGGKGSRGAPDKKDGLSIGSWSTSKKVFSGPR